MITRVRGAEQLPMPMTYARIMLREIGTTPARRAHLLEGTSISETLLGDPAAEARLSDFLTMFENAHTICPPGWTLSLTRRFELAAQGALGFAMACAPTLGDAFDVMARYGHVRAPWFRLEVFQERGEWGVKIRRQFPVSQHVDVAMVESVLLSGQTLVESVLGRPIREASMYFDFAPPPWSDLYREYFSGKLHFGCEDAAFGMPAGWRSLLCPLTDAGMYHAAVNRLEMDRRRLDSSNALTARVSLLLAASGDAGVDLETVAERINMSRRTLIRRLKEAGTSFGELLDTHRESRARILLANPEFSVAEVGYRLGYAEPANFTRAFKKWSGMTPLAYRRSLA
jgi:AraC-like DNA-binding protein